MKQLIPSYSSLACGLLQDGERYFFLKQKDRQGVERIGLPCAFLIHGQDPLKNLSEAFLEQTGIDGHVQGVVLKSRYNIGTRRNKRYIPVLGFFISSKSAKANVSKKFSGFCWLSLNDAKKKKLMRSCEWLLFSGFLNM
jgi:hypothetical protein